MPRPVGAKGEGTPGPRLELEVSVGVGMPEEGELELVEPGLAPEGPVAVPLPPVARSHQPQLVCATATDAPSTSVISRRTAVFIAFLIGLECYASANPAG